MFRAASRSCLGVARGGALSSSCAWRMRFDKEAPPSSRGVQTPYADVPESMRPKKVAPHFTPFPLPKYDEELGFGPVRLSDIPDLEVAAQRMREAAETAGRATRYMDAEDLARDLGLTSIPAEEAPSTPTASETASRAAATTADDHARGTREAADDLGDGYVVEDEHFPVLDRLTCQRSLEDLLAQFTERPAREARTATVLDLANTMQVRTDAELEKMLYELGALFTADGNGLQFLAAKVTKFGRAYYAADELMKAFVHFVDAATETLVQEQPTRLTRSPALFVQLLHFLAQIKVFEPNLWYSPNPNAPSNRTDYTHARGINLTTAHKRTGEELYDYMTHIILCEEEEAHGFLGLCTNEQLLDLLAGFGAVMPQGLPEGEVANAIVGALLSRLITQQGGGVLTQPADVTTLERLYLLLNLFNIRNEAVLSALLRTSADGGRLSLGGEAATLPRGPNFFAAVAREKRHAIQRQAAVLLEESVQAARANHDASLLAALAESGFEFLLSLRDKAAAVALARKLELDTLLLENIPSMETVARRLALERDSRTARAAAEAPQLTGVQRTLIELLQSGQGGDASEESASPPATATPAVAPYYVTMFEGRRVHPVRTLLSDLLYAKQMDSVFLLHSSVVGGAVEALVSAVRRVQSGKDAVVVTMSCLREVAARAHYSRTDTERENARRVLSIIAYEAEKGRVMLLPASEELALHDAGTYCDEDLMLWTVAAFFARELPLVRVSTLMSQRTTARDPHRHLKGEHSPLTATMDLYQPDAPLLQSLRSKELRSVTHHVQLRRKVRDRESRLHDTNPSRARFAYRRDRAMFDKYHVTARHLAPGFSRGALGSDLRGLGYYTPDHPQVPYTPVKQKVSTRTTAASQPFPTLRAGQQ